MSTPVKYNSIHSLFFHEHFSPKCEVDIHIHDNYEIYQALGSNIRYYVEGSSYDLSEGDIIITSSHELHRPITINQQTYARRFVQFNPMIITQLINLNYNPLRIFESRKLGRNNLIHVPDIAKPVVSNYFKTIEASLLSSSPRHHYEAWLTLHGFLMELESLYDASAIEKSLFKPHDTTVFRVKDYLDQHFCEPFSLDIISRHHHMDKFHLSHIFKQSTGFTLLEYIQAKRILKAINLLSTSQSILEISQACGYEDYSNFYKTFKKMTSLSPKNYRATQIG